MTDRRKFLRFLAGSQTVETEVKTKAFVLIDCFHLTACLRPGVVVWEDVSRIDTRLAAIGCSLVLLDADDSTVRDRVLHAGRNSEFLDYVTRRFGPGENQVIRHFLEERDHFRNFFKASRMRKLTVRAEASESALTESAFAFRQRTDNATPKVAA